MRHLQGKTLFITGASRGIGKAIALRAAKDNANIAVVSKTATQHPKLPGTVYSAVAEIEAAGGSGLACIADVRNDEQMEEAVAKTVKTFGGIDVLINNAGAIFLADASDTPVKRFDLMHQINVRAPFVLSRLCLPHLIKSANPHILHLSPPINLDQKWFTPHVAYTISKYAMSMLVIGLSGEFEQHGVAVNALWPRTLIATAAVQNLFGGDDAIKGCRLPEIVADAAYAILSRDSRECTGNFFVDDEVLAESGDVDLAKYSVSEGAPLTMDLFLEP